MPTKEIMKKYFLMRSELAAEGLDFLFKTPVNDFDSLEIYEGEVDEDEYISWKPVEMTVSLDFNIIENDFNIKVHSSIVEYFNSYWFADLDGFYKEYYIKLEPVLPNAELSSLIKTVTEYKKNHGNKLDYIPIGIEGNGLLLVIENKSGLVQLEDFDRGSFEPIAENLQELIGNIRLLR